MNSSNSVQNEFASGRWTDEEQGLFIFGLMKYGKDWKRFENMIKSRNSSQIRSHAQKFFLKIGHIRKLQKKIKYKQKTYSSVFSQEETKLLEMLKAEVVTEKTPNDILAVLQGDTPKKSDDNIEDQMYNEHSISLEQSKSRKNSRKFSQSYSSTQSILGIPFQSVFNIKQSFSKLPERGERNRSFFCAMIQQNLQRVMQVDSILELVDLPVVTSLEDPEKIEQQFSEIQNEVVQLSSALKKQEILQHFKSPGSTRLKDKICEQNLNDQLRNFVIPEK